MKKTALFISALILSAGCTNSPRVDVAAEAGLLRDLELQMIVAYQNRDVEKIMSFASSEILQMVPDLPSVAGIENCRKRMESELADTVYLWETYLSNIDFIEVSSSGDLAYVRGNDLLKKKTPDGIVDDPAKWVDIWKKIDGQWKLALNIWNR